MDQIKEDPDKLTSMDVERSSEANPYLENQFQSAEKDGEEKHDHCSEEFLAPLFRKAHGGLLKLNELIDDGTESVTNIREAAIQNEIERQKADESDQHALKKYIEKKEIEALKEYQIIDEKWEQIKKLKDPLNIHNETIAQREKCKALLQEKDSVIEYLKETLKKKDETFLNAVEEQGSEVNLLIDRIEQQINTLKEAYTSQLVSLEDIIDEEKNLIIDTNREKWDKLIQEKDEVDKTYLQKLCNVIDHHEKSMLLSGKELHENRRTMRLKLDKIRNDLTVQNDSIKSLCALNIEKITYNYQILLKKKQDHKTIKQHYCRYFSRMGTQLATIRKSIEEDRKRMADLITEYTYKFDKINNSIMSLDERHIALALSNSKIYFELWEFNEKEVKQLIEKILAMDKILHEEILFTTWSNPYELRQPKPPCYEKAKNLHNDLIRFTKIKPKTVQNTATSSMEMEMLKIIFDSLKTSCGFLIEKKPEENKSLEIPSKAKNLLALENIFEVLGVKSNYDTRELMHFFLPNITCLECDVGLSESEEFPQDDKGTQDDDQDELLMTCPKEKGEVQETDVVNQLESDEIHRQSDKIMQCLKRNHHPFINPLDISKALRDFTSNLFKRGKSFPEDEILSKEWISPSEAMVAEEVTDYWESFLKPFDADKIRLWETMVVAVQKYEKMLHRRHNLNIEVKKLKRNNFELRRLLQRYVSNAPNVNIFPLKIK